MPRILTTCPTSGREVPTGRRTQDVDLATFTGALGFRCPGCAQVHTWQAAEAWAENDAASRPAPRLAA